MGRVVSILVLALTLSAALGHDTRPFRHHADADRPAGPSHGASRWHERAPGSSAPIIESLPIATPVLERSVQADRFAVAADRTERLTVVPSHTARPHDPPHLHAFSPLI